VLIMESGPNGWELFLAPATRSPWEALLAAITELTRGWRRPRLGGVMPLDNMGH